MRPGQGAINHSDIWFSFVLGGHKSGGKHKYLDEEMECNKDEAIRAKEIAEKKIIAKDIPGAKKFAHKAENLYPGLEGMPQLFATLNVYLSAENKIGGEADLYEILGVNSKADDEVVRKQYRKLALMLHPDKNKSVGAEGAFQIISEAWSLLSDKAQRRAYDQRRNSQVHLQKVPHSKKGPSMPPKANTFYDFTKPTTSVKTQKSTSSASPSFVPPPPKPKANTFWTVCHTCKMQYEYLGIYLNRSLLCPNCHVPFMAVETAPPPINGSKSSTTWDFSQKQPNSNHQAASKKTSNPGRSNANSPNVVHEGEGSDSFNSLNFQWGRFSRTAAGASTVAQAATVVQQAYEKVKREREEFQAATKREEALNRKNNMPRKNGGVSSVGLSSSAKRRKGMDDTSMGNNRMVSTTHTGNAGFSLSGVCGARRGVLETVGVNGINNPNSGGQVSQFEIRNMLILKARIEIRSKFNEWKSGAIVKPLLAEVNNGKGGANEKKKNGEKENAFITNGEKCVQNKPGRPVETKNRASTIWDFTGNPDVNITESMTIDVPDPDFHDFDKDRTESSFGENQVWAAYDNDDGMPRFYALIHGVISLNPFNVKISWLNSKNNSEFGPLDWVGSGFSKTCGDFRVGRHEINKSLNSFSHKVRWSKGARGAIGIYPRKGDVWALYRDWSPDWDELTADEVIHKYDIVEVLEDYSEELGVAATPLVKVAGFKTVFHQHLDPSEIRRIPREEMFRFSHHVPSYLLTGQEATNAPKGCRELDPAATPLEFLQIIPDVKEEDIIENGDDFWKETVVDVQKPNERKAVETLTTEMEEPKK